MNVSGSNYARELLAGERVSVKMVFNARGAILFPASEQHRDQKANGVSYEDDYAGNALAATLTNQQIEVRYHRDFSDAQVRTIIDALNELPEMHFIREWRVTYQGRDLSRGA